MNINEFKKYISDRKVVCFGTGEMAKSALKDGEIRRRVSCFLDNSPTKQGKNVQFYGLSFPVLSPEQYLQTKDSSENIILITSGYFRDIEAQLSSTSVKAEVFSYPVIRVDYTPEDEAFFEDRILGESLKEYGDVLEQYHISGGERASKMSEMENYIRGESAESRPLVIPRVMVMPTTRCNLRCKGCSSLLPMFTSPRDIELDRLLKDFSLFFAAVDKCIRITVGGEPFLYTNLKSVLEYLLHEEKVLSIMLITNSTIMPNQEILELLANRKIFVEISDYGHLEKMSRLIVALEGAGVNFKVLTEQTWTDMGGVSCRNRSKEEIRFNYLTCDQSRVIKGMHDGRFYTCARSARMTALGAYSSENDSFALDEDAGIDAIRANLKKMYYSDYADACNYCDLGALPAKVIEAGIQLTGPMKKSSYTIVSREEYEELKRMAKLK